jgi:hypothetical protein
VIVDRVRSVCAAAPFGFMEAESWAHVRPAAVDTNIDAVFRIPPPRASVRGGFATRGRPTDTLQIWVARKRNGDYDAVRRALLRDVHSLTAAVCATAVSSGDYDVPDSGRGHQIHRRPRASEYVTLRLTLPVNYEAQL